MKKQSETNKTRDPDIVKEGWIVLFVVGALIAAMLVIAGVVGLVYVVQSIIQSLC